MSSQEERKYVIEAALFASVEPLTAERLQLLFDGRSRPSVDEVKELIAALQEDYAERSIALVKVASGYRFQVKKELAPWLQRLWEKKPARYTRALLETLALVAYRQPLSRGEIEEVRGVAVSSDIMKKLQEREWIKVVGHRDVPGKPALFGTTKHFLDYFNLTNLSELPPLQEIVDLDKIEQQLGQQLVLSVENDSDQEESPMEEIEPAAMAVESQPTVDE